MNQEAKKVKCPNCGFELDVNEILYHQLDEELKKLVTDRWGTIRTERNPQREQVIGEMRKRNALAHAVKEPGVYRVEAYRRYKGLKRAWIFSNPIYIY